MNWLIDTIRPRIRLGNSKKDDNTAASFTKCPECHQMLYIKALKEELYVCSSCGHHLSYPAQERLKNLFDEGTLEMIPTDHKIKDPLSFKDQQRYSDRLKNSQQKTGQKDATLIGAGKLRGQPLVGLIFDFRFMGGSMGIDVGQSIIKASEEAIKRRSGLLIISSSGGARMQEGILSLMQMARTTVAINRLKESGLPYIVLLSHPTTGGVTASFAMIGDFALAEPKCLIGFAGRRVIEETIREKLPEDFQTAEYLLDHGMIDLIAPRAEQKDVLERILKHTLPQTRSVSPSPTQSHTSHQAEGSSAQAS